MTRRMSEDEARKQRELMVRVARSPEFSCCCIRLAKEDRRRAKRIFRLSRRMTRSWERDLREEAKADESRTS